MNNILEKSSRAVPKSKTNKTKEILNKIETKEFGFVYDKRVIVENFDTILFYCY
jgi:hypothetical protein